MLLLCHMLAAGDTSALDTIAFYPAGAPLLATESWGGAVLSVASLNAGLWASANTTQTETPFSKPPHPAGLETVLNFSASPACLGAVANLSDAAAGVATLPTSADAAVVLGKAYGLSYAQCASHCCTSQGCAAFAWYDTASQGPLCQPFTAGYTTGPQPYSPSADVRAAVGGVLHTAAARVDHIANGLRSGTFLGGVGTGGYELRADGTFHLSTLRNQSPAAEPWQGTVRDAVLAVALDGVPHVVRLRPFGGLSAVPQLVYQERFPVAKLSGFLGPRLALYAYSALAPGDSDGSNTPAVAFTLHAEYGGETAAPFTNVTFVVVQPFAVRNDWRQGANFAGTDSGTPGSWSYAASPAGQPAVRFSTGSTATASGAPEAFNGLGSQALFVPPVQLPAGAAAAGCRVSRGVGAAGTVEALLAALRGADPASVLNHVRPAAAAADSALFAAAAASVSNLPAPGSSSVVSLSVVHSWHFPHSFFYRDSLGGSDNGVRYAATYAGVDDVGDALNLTLLSRNLAAWQEVYGGLSVVDPLLSDAAFNYFNHLRSAIWTGPLPTSRGASNISSSSSSSSSGGGGKSKSKSKSKSSALAPQFRQWESLEFTDFSNPTNGDERHLPYFHTLPETMRSKLLSEAAFAQDGDGMFQCVVNSMSGDQQWGTHDPCPDTAAGHRTTASHPDDISMFMVGVYELYMMANDTALVDDLYERALLPAFGYYTRVYNASAWHVPFKAHETYDAVKESSGVTGEGNLGASLYNALNYLCGLHCMRGFAAHRGDASTEAAASGMINLVQASIQEHFWLPTAGHYAGDTAADYSILMEPDDPSVAYHSSDGLHGQVLAYRLGFGDLLPRRQMLAHQRFVSADLATPWGLSFDRYAQENWLMADHTNAALFLRWHAPEGWGTALAQARYWREVKKEATRHAAVLSTRTGEYKLLNYYGYALYFFHTISAWAGQTVHLPHRSFEFQPHPSAFDGESGVATLSVLLGGDLGTLTVTPANATLRMAFLGAAELSFLNVTVCQHVFTAGAGGVSPFVVTKDQPLVLDLPTPCNLD